MAAADSTTSAMQHAWQRQQNRNLQKLLATLKKREESNAAEGGGVRRKKQSINIRSHHSITADASSRDVAAMLESLNSRLKLLEDERAELRR